LQQLPFLQVQHHLLERRPVARLAHADAPGDRGREAEVLRLAGGA
jgi:hypothetical protein